MLRNLLAIVMIVVVIASSQAQYQGPLASIVREQAGLVMVADLFAFAEGPAADQYGNIYFTDQPFNQIWQYDTVGRLRVFKDGCGRANGTYFDRKGNLITCSDEHNELWSISPDGSHKVILSDIKGKKLNGPNDLWISPKGAIYFTDPYYHRNYWQQPEANPTERPIYLLKANRKKVIKLDNTLKQPNGIVGSPDGKTLYVSDIDDQKTYKYTIARNGKLKNKQLFVAQGSDGMTLDNQGNLYLTGKGVTVYDASGKLIGNIKVPTAWTGNVCFGGKDRQTLFITASSSVFTLEMNVKGAGY